MHVPFTQKILEDWAGRQAFADGMALFPALYKAFTEKDMSLLEINPLIVMKNGRVRVLDFGMAYRWDDAAWGDVREALRDPGTLEELVSPLP